MFTVHYEVASSSIPVGPLVVNDVTPPASAVPTPPSPRTPASPPPSPSSPVVEFVSLPDATPDGDDDDGAPRRYRTVANILGTTAPVELDSDELYLVAAEEPSNFSEAEHDDLWRQAMLEELNSIEENNTWMLTDLPVHQGREGITITQSAYAGKLLRIAGLGECNPTCIPMEPRLKLPKNSDRLVVASTLYRSLVGSLRYLVHTRPDIAFAVGYVSRFMETPHDNHLMAVKHILQYVADSDLGGDVDDRKSTSGALFFLGSSPIAWQSQKQKVVALSSCEAEYIAATGAACLGIWLARLLAEVLGTEPEMAILKVADILTKPLGRIKFQEFRSKAGVVQIVTWRQD
ncbi:Os08g0484000 [Oryza sativa Japonica Group]|uniref:Os08g0484000 protein n=1 Tax=Oryza sativa subsp. japonica TaxID=39947 RepID=C7J5J4_ORYSJ|nr:Os08g0484000 [Oryza sativa Japonica Group]|eukprot:NP_001175633.1 Os08g0484000 [Oryza sativa Japonica Group]